MVVYQLYSIDKKMDFKTRVQKTIPAYRVGYRSLRVENFNENGYLTEDFLLLITRKLKSTLRANVDGPIWIDRGFYSVPESEKIIKVSAGDKEFKEDNYIELFVFTDENLDDMGKTLDVGKKKAEPILALINLCLGERALDIKIIEDFHEVSLEYNEVEHGEQTSINYNLKSGDLTPSIRNEITFPIVSLFTEGMKPLSNLYDNYRGLDDIKKNQADISLRWYRKGLLEDSLEDRFIAFWVAFESISMKGSTDLGIARKFLADMLNISVNKVNEKLEIGRLYGCRRNIFHGNKIQIENIRHFCNKLHDILEESLRNFIGVGLTGQLNKYF